MDMLMRLGPGQEFFRQEQVWIRRAGIHQAQRLGEIELDQGNTCLYGTKK
jgi:hypothetical protein